MILRERLLLAIIEGAGGGLLHVILRERLLLAIIEGAGFFTSRDVLGRKK